ncbi:cyclopropane-fatty-acyl-phospholipid synthase [Lysobacter fragariae]
MSAARPRDTATGFHPLRDRLERLLEAADVRIDGERPWDMQLHDTHVPARILAQGSLGLGETYMDGGWDTQSLDGLLFRLLDARVDERVHGAANAFDGARARLFNLQSRRRSHIVGEQHYDLGNELYRAMLGKRMVYSCGYWRNAGNLDDAQEAKLDLVCRKLSLRPGMRVLDIGCGWGEALRFAAHRHGVGGLGVTISQEQAAYAADLCAGLPIAIRVHDYRELESAVRADDERTPVIGRPTDATSTDPTSRRDAPFDRVFSVGMFEHVGVKNYRRYFEVARHCLRDNGLFLLHTIGNNVSERHTDPWIARYIFPNSMLPSAAQIARAAEGLFVIEDWHGFGTDYDLTLQAWRDNIEAAWDSLPPRYDERFRRMWRFYLAGAMASFRARRLQLWQIVFSTRGVRGGYAERR